MPKFRNVPHRYQPDNNERFEEMDVETIAMVAHEVNRAYCLALGDKSQPAWGDAPSWQKDSAISGVVFHIENDVSPEQSHKNWMRHKEDDGWVFGPEKCAEKKTHPCMVDYDHLPENQKVKDYLFKAVVDALKDA